MTTFLAQGFFVALLLTIIIVAKKGKIIADYCLMGLLAIYALTIGGAWFELYNLTHYYPCPHYMNVSWLFLLLHGPILWLYTRALTENNFSIKQEHLLHLLPFTIFVIIHYFNFMHLPAEDKILIMSKLLFMKTPLYIISVVVIGISSLTYNIWVLALLKKHRQNIENQYSDIEEIDLAWLNRMAIASLIVFSVNVAIYNLNNVIPIIGYYQQSKIAYVLATLYLLYLGFYGIRQGRIFTNTPNSSATEEKKLETEEGLKELENPHLDTVVRLKELMELQKPHLDPQLTIARLASQLKIKPEQLSEVLNTTINQNFYDYINKHRIEEFKIQCLNPDNKHLSILGIAYECGFNSKAAFYRAFKKFENTSPTNYKSMVS